MAKQKKEKPTDVIFRMWKVDGEEELIALFPTIESSRGCCESYMHVDQYASANYDLILQNSRPAKEPEYRELYNELIGIGYSLKIKKRKSWKTYLSER